MKTLLALALLSMSPLTAFALTLRADFNRSWTTLGGLNADFVFDKVAARYAEFGRVYHTLAHVDDCAQKLAAISAEDPLTFAARHELLVALVFHDAAYDLTPNNTSNNEADSRELFCALAGPLDETAASVIDGLIMATRTHDGLTRLEDVMVDIDLAIFGADRNSFVRFERGIRAEYDWVDEDTYRRERSRILGKFLARRPIYRTSFFRTMLEERARRNLEGLIESLDTPR